MGLLLRALVMAALHLGKSSRSLLLTVLPLCAQVYQCSLGLWLVPLGRERLFCLLHRVFTS